MSWLPAYGIPVKIYEIDISFLYDFSDATSS